MKRTIKCVISLILVASTLFALLMLSSCGITGSIESFLTSESYTFKSNDVTVMVEKDKVYANNGDVKKYIYYSREEKSYFYCEIKSTGKVTKRPIDSEQYIVYHGLLVDSVAKTSMDLTSFLQIVNTLEPVDGVYTFGSYKITEKDGVLTITKDKSVITISDIGATTVKLPEALNGAATE